ncbi:L-tryptophan--pyruvate aminotransferase 1 [Linum perenne]
MGGQKIVGDENKTTTTNKKLSPVINLDRGDPAVFEPYWRKNGDKCTITISGHDSLSYFSDPNSVCWFMESELQNAVRRVHRVVGNAETEGYHVVVGTGSTMLFQAALYALSTPVAPGSEPVNVVCAAPYYSQYKEQVEMLQSRLYEWGGDARTYSKATPFIEVVTSPNNPDGSPREAVVGNRDDGKVIHDLAYYWPNYIPITRVADHDIMLFTLTKCTGHAGSRIGWALVKDKEVARKMTMFMQVTTIGVSKDSQLRAAKILEFIANDCERAHGGGNGVIMDSNETFFGQGRLVLAKRWEKLRAAMKGRDVFITTKYPQQYCNFSGKYFQPVPAFGWLTCKEGCDAMALMKAHNVLTRGGEAFGVSSRYTRISMIGHEDEFDRFVDRVSEIKSDNEGFVTKREM